MGQADRRSLGSNKVVQRQSNVQRRAGVDLRQSGLKLGEAGDDAMEQAGGCGDVHERRFGLLIDRPVVPVLDSGQLTALQKVGNFLVIRTFQHPLDGRQGSVGEDLMRLRQSDRVKTSIVSPPHGDKMARTLGRRGANTLTAPQACCPRVSPLRGTGPASGGRCLQDVEARRPAQMSRYRAPAESEGDCTVGRRTRAAGRVATRLPPATP